MIAYTHHASVRFKCSVCCGSLMTTYIYFYVYFYIYIFILHILISRPFEITILLFFTLPLESYCPKVFELSLVTNIILTSVSYDYATFFNNDCKKARDAVLSCRCHLSNIMPGSILHECMGQRYLFCCFVSFLVIAVWFYFSMVGTSVFLRMKEM